MSKLSELHAIAEDMINALEPYSREECALVISHVWLEHCLSIPDSPTRTPVQPFLEGQEMEVTPGIAKVLEEYEMAEERKRKEQDMQIAQSYAERVAAGVNSDSSDSTPN